MWHLVNHTSATRACGCLSTSFSRFEKDAHHRGTPRVCSSPNAFALRFLLIRWSGMGDIIMTLPAVKWLRQTYPGCRIVYLTDSAFADIPGLSGTVDTTLMIDRRGFGHIGRFLPAVFSLIKTVYALLISRFDGAFDLQGFGETAVLAYLSSAPLRAGRVKASALRRWIYNAPIRADWQTDHRARYFLKAVTRACGENTPPEAPAPYLPNPWAGSDHGPPRIGLNLGASTESRRWSERHFIDLAKILSAHGCRIRLILGPQEAALVAATRPACDQNLWELIQCRNFSDMLAAVSECALVVSNDTGPGHLAAALGLPVVTLFSSGDPDNVRPLAVHHQWFRNQSDINRIPVAHVSAAVLDLLTSAGVKGHLPL